MKKASIKESNEIEQLAIDYLDFIGGKEELSDIDISGGWKRDRRSVQYFKEMGLDLKTANNVVQKALTLESTTKRKPKMTTKTEQLLRKMIREELLNERSYSVEDVQNLISRTVRRETINDISKCAAKLKSDEGISPLILSHAFAAWGKSFSE